HPADADFAAAGTGARWVADGLEVTYVLVTRGDAGGFDDTPRAAMPAIREAEQRAAAAVVGVKQVEFLDGYADGTVTVTPALRRDLTRAIRRYRPDRILTNSPVRRWDRGLGGPNHPDPRPHRPRRRPTRRPPGRGTHHRPRQLTAGLPRPRPTHRAAPRGPAARAADVPSRSPSGRRGRSPPGRRAVPE